MVIYVPQQNHERGEVTLNVALKSRQLRPRKLLLALTIW